MLDLDNTLWGGVIGDDGLDKIQIGRETAVAEAYTAFQEYCLRLRERGILLAVCSKNNEAIAKQGFEHPDSVLKLEHFAAFKANWEPKHENILAIAKELNLGVDSFVFVDDNPAERAIVEAQIPGIAVPDVGADVSRYASILEAGTILRAGLPGARRTSSAPNSTRTTPSGPAPRCSFANYGEYLDSLEMTAEIEPFRPVYMERIAQLTNKTNQFNLTTRRYTLAEMEAAAADGRHIGTLRQAQRPLRRQRPGLRRHRSNRRARPAPRSVADELPRSEARHGVGHARPPRRARPCCRGPYHYGYYLPTPKNEHGGRSL